MTDLKLKLCIMRIYSCLEKWRRTLYRAEIYIADNDKFKRQMKRANKYMERYLKLAKQREELIEEIKLEAWSND